MPIVICTAFLKKTVGIMFFGTPHRGADPRNILHHVLQTSAKALGAQVNEQIVRALMPDAELLPKLRDEFTILCNEKSWPIFSFQEEYGVWSLFGKKVVDDQSSCLDNPALEIRQHISRNHMDMCRFSGLQDPEYRKVEAALKRILGTIEARKRCEKRSPMESSISGDLRTSLVERLYFSKIDERLTHLTPAQGFTCRWFLDTPQYTSWRDITQQADHGGFLWIKGNPGTGKSTLMKFLFEHAREETGAEPSQITLSFFFLARGTAEEKSTAGLYRSVLHQLFEKAGDLRDSLECLTLDGARGIQLNGWHEEALKKTFCRAVQGLGSRSLTIFVDALDECEDSQARNMVFFFEELCDMAQQKQVRLRICFSSRHYPHIEIEKGIELTLEDEQGHKEDIEKYIKTKLRLSNKKTKLAQSLHAELLERSSLIFLWVVLVVDILNSESPRNPNIDKMRKRLRTIPPKLADLFEMILTRDEEGPKLMQICLQWILFATRPLKPQELYFAIQFGLNEDSCSGRWDQEATGMDDLKVFVRHSSKGLAEVTRNKASEVQFIHESVRDFLMGRYGDHWSGAGTNFVGHSHELLRDCCLAQLVAIVQQNVNMPRDMSPQSVQIRKDVKLEFPFFEYSVAGVLHHANSAQQHGVDQMAFITERFASHFRSWLKLNNFLEKHGVRRYEDTVSLVYILAEKNLAELIKIYPRDGSCFDVGTHNRPPRYGPPIFAALTNDRHDAARALLEAEVRVQPPNFQLHRLCQQYFENERQLRSFDRTFTFSKQKSVLSHLAEHGDEVLLSFLLNLVRVEINSTNDLRYPPPLVYAAKKRHAAVMELLLEAGADVDSVDGTRRTALLYAAANRDERIVKLLLDGGADPEAKDPSGRTPLSLTPELGNESIAKLLLDWGADVDSKNEYGRTPLSYAVVPRGVTFLSSREEGWKAVVKLLLKNGADARAEDRDGKTPLSRVAEREDKAMMELLAG
ncbi:uncharacterized protein B0T15DRAFT_519936 [Chaetomium strumarium]|uniref:Nephrocystin 3-like N-terminal domain-containing protein n=1 Tax=Chaetomium strumarium TaxID=1170767 RepID=A0AAJ0H354_9PEZI|nr:hypothetical protein B0T15DRAFT_519936 [Chaetomium strumarium]